MLGIEPDVCFMRYESQTILSLMKPHTPRSTCLLEHRPHYQLKNSSSMEAQYRTRVGFEALCKQSNELVYTKS